MLIGNENEEQIFELGESEFGGSETASDERDADHEEEVEEPDAEFGHTVAIHHAFQRLRQAVGISTGNAEIRWPGG